MPWGAVWALALLAAIELLMRWGYDPRHVPELYAANFPDHRYAFERARPRCWRAPGVIECYGDEYQPIPRQSLIDPKPADTIRVIVVGTSPSYGTEAYPARLGEPLERALGREVEVLNLAVRGHGTTRMLEQLDEALGLDPDVIVIHPHGTNEYEDERDAAYVAALHEGVPGLIRRSEFATVLQKLAAGRLYRRARGIVDLRKAPQEESETANTEKAAGEIPANVARWQAKIVANTELMVERARASGATVVLVGRGERPGPDGSAWVDYMDGLLRPIARHDPGIDYVDPMAVLKAGGADPADAFVDTSHFNARGHREIASALAETIAVAVTSHDHVR
ncbi:MAG: SGNH/GDSL hydrolase family protein [Enhygromyxa sp.]